MKRRLLALVILFSRTAGAEWIKKPFTYEDGDTRIEGYFVYDSSWKDPRPGILVTHAACGPPAEVMHGRRDEFTTAGGKISLSDHIRRSPASGILIASTGLPRR